MRPTTATVFRFLRNHDAAVLATLSGTYPNTTPINYTVSKNKTLYFVTRDQTTKYTDIIACNSVSLSVLDSFLPIAVNMTARARIIDNSKEAQYVYRSMRQLTISGQAPVLKHKRGNFVAIELQPIRIQYTDFSARRDLQETYIFDL